MNPAPLPLTEFERSLLEQTKAISLADQQKKLLETQARLGALLEENANRTQVA